MTGIKYGQIRIVDVGSVWTKALQINQAGMPAYTPRQPEIIPTLPGGLAMIESRKGNELCLASCSAGGCLRLAVLGLTYQETWADVKALLRGTGIILAGVLTADQGFQSVEQAVWLQRMAADAVLVLGGYDGASLSSLADLVQVLAASPICQGRPVLFAGNQAAADLVYGLLGACCRLQVLPNLRPTPEEANFGTVRKALQKLQQTHAVQAFIDYPTLQRWSIQPVLPTSAALAAAGRAVAAGDERWLTVDLGARTVNVTSVNNGKDEHSTSPYGWKLGLFELLPHLMTNRNLPALQRQQLDLVGNMSLGAPLSSEVSKNLQDALIRLAIQLAVQEHSGLFPGQLSATPNRGHWWEQLQPPALPAVGATQVLGTGGLFSRISAPRAMLALLEGVQPEGVAELFIDALGVWPLLGTSRYHGQLLTTDLRQSLHLLSTVIRPSGSFHKGQRLFRLTMWFDKGRCVELQVRGGEFFRISQTVGETLKVELVPEQTIDLGAGPGVPRETQMQGGSQGLLIDCRGRWPLREATEPEEAVNRRISPMLGKRPVADRFSGGEPIDG